MERTRYKDIVKKGYYEFDAELKYVYLYSSGTIATRKTIKIPVYRVPEDIRPKYKVRVRFAKSQGMVVTSIPIAVGDESPWVWQDPSDRWHPICTTSAKFVGLAVSEDNIDEIIERIRDFAESACLPDLAYYYPKVQGGHGKHGRLGEVKLEANRFFRSSGNDEIDWVIQ